MQQRRKNMIDPGTALMAAGKIMTLAVQKFIESGSGELGKKFTTEAVTKMDILLNRIWRKLQGKPRVEEVRESVEKNQKITSDQISQIAAYLQVAMDEDSQFANEVCALAKEINKGKRIDKSTMIQNNSDQAKGWQSEVNGGTAYIGEIHIHRQPD
jgi:hypothetical protein